MIDADKDISGAAAGSPADGADISDVGDGKIDFSTLPPGMLLSRKAVADALGRTVRTIERAEKVGALPPSFLWQGRRLWRAGPIQDFFDRLALQAVKDARKLENIP